MTFFGQCNADGSVTATPDGYTGHLDGIVSWNAFTSPANARRLVSLGWYGKLLSGTGSVRLALYNAAGTLLIAQTGIITVNSATPQWWEDATLAAAIAASTSYLIVAAQKSAGLNDLDVGYYTGGGKTHIDANATQTYVTNGFPASLPASSTQFDQYILRAGTSSGLLLRRRRRLLA